MRSVPYRRPRRPHDRSRGGHATHRLALKPVLCLALCGLGSCSLLSGGSATSRQQALSQPQAAFASRGITVQVRADAGLNPAGGQPHSVVVGVLQSAQADALRALAADPAAVVASLASGEPVPGTLQLSRFVVFPAQRCTIHADRVQNARAAALIVGYATVTDNPFANARAGPSLAVFEYPLQVQSHGWLWRSYSATVEPLQLQLRLGPREVLDASIAPASTPADPASPASPPPPDCRALPPPGSASRA